MRPAPGPRARRRNRAREPRRRVTRPRTGARDTRETGFRRTGRPAADWGATGGRRKRPLPPRPARSRTEERVLRPALARAQAQSGAQSGAPPRIAPADGRTRYARNRVPPLGPAGGRQGRNRKVQGTASPAPAARSRRRSAPCALPSRAGRRNQAREPRRRVSRPQTGAGDTRETGFRRTGRPAAGWGATGGRREQPLPPRPARGQAEECVLRPALARAGAIRRTNRAAAYRARGRAQATRAKQGSAARAGRRRAGPQPGGAGNGLSRPGPPAAGRRSAPCARPSRARARAQSGARTAPPRIAPADGRARYARNRVPPLGPAGGGQGRNRGAQGTAPPAPACPQTGGGVRPAPCPRARGRNRAREPRRRVTRPRMGARITRETGFRRTGRPAADRGATGGAGNGLSRPGPPAAGRRSASCARPSRARAQSGARTAPPHNAPADGRARYARNRVPPHRPAGGGQGRNRGAGNEPLPPRPARSRAEECVLRPALARAQAQSGARTAPPRNAPAAGRARYARNRVPPHRPAGGGQGRDRGCRERPLPSRPARSQAEVCVLRPALARGRNQARQPRRRVTRADGRRRYARNRVPPHKPAGGGPGRNRGGGGAGNGLSRPGPPATGRRSAPCALPSRAQAQSGARTAPPRNAPADGRARYARNRVPPLGPTGGGPGRNRGAQGTASPAPARPQPGGRVCLAAGPRARRRNQAREPRRRITRPRTGARDTRETGFRRSGRPAAGWGATGGRRERPLPPRPARSRAEECALRRPSRAQAQSGAPPRYARAGGRA